MKVKTIRSSWWPRYGYRLDCQPYLSGGLEAKVILEALPGRKDRLRDVTADGDRGIYHAGREARHWVDSPSYGIRFLSSSDILNADLSKLPLISKKQVAANPLLLIRKGYTLITRSGTIGRIAYARTEMDGLACSEHVLRVVAEPTKIPSGYLYTFLSSKFGIPLVIAGTYGLIIQSIEPEHIADIPVPRFAPRTELNIHNLIEDAANLRTRASKLRCDAIRAFETAIGWRGTIDGISVNISSSKGLERRMDSHYRHARVVHARKALANTDNFQTIASMVESVFSPDIAARHKVDDERFGVPFLSSSEVFRINPTPDYLISRSTPQFNTFILHQEDVLVPRSGSIGGIIGRAVLHMPTASEWAGTEHLIRVRCHSADDAAYLWVVLASEPGYWAVVGTAFGSAIPSLDAELLGAIRVPVYRTSEYESLVEAARGAVALCVTASDREKEAMSILENAVEEYVK